MPALSRVAVLWNGSIKSMALGYQMIEQAAPTLGVTIQSVRVSGADQFDEAFAAIERGRPGGLIVLFGPLRGDDLPRIVDFVAQHRIPAVFEIGQGVRGGGLMEFGPSQWRMARRAAAYIDKIANGANPAGLPVEEPTVFELVRPPGSRGEMVLELEPLGVDKGKVVERKVRDARVTIEPGVLTEGGYTARLRVGAAPPTR